MMQIMQNSILMDEFKEKIEEFVNENIELGEQRIIVTIDSNGVKTKIVTPLPKKQRKTRIAPEMAKRVQEAKEALKGRRDLIYVVTLLFSLINELKKINVSELPSEAQETLISAASDVRANLANMTKKIEERGEK